MHVPPRPSSLAPRRRSLRVHERAARGGRRPRERLESRSPLRAAAGALVIGAVLHFVSSQVTRPPLGLDVAGVASASPTDRDWDRPTARMTGGPGTCVFANLGTAGWPGWPRRGCGMPSRRGRLRGSSDAQSRRSSSRIALVGAGRAAMRSRTSAALAFVSTTLGGTKASGGISASAARWCSNACSTTNACETSRPFTNRLRRDFVSREISAEIRILAVIGHLVRQRPQDCRECGTGRRRPTPHAAIERCSSRIVGK